MGDRFGRAWALGWSILCYSVVTGASYIAYDPATLLAHAVRGELGDRRGLAQFGVACQRGAPAIATAPFGRLDGGGGQRRLRAVGAHRLRGEHHARGLALDALGQCHSGRLGPDRAGRRAGIAAVVGQSKSRRPWQGTPPGPRDSSAAAAEPNADWDLPWRHSRDRHRGQLQLARPLVRPGGRQGPRRACRRQCPQRQRSRRPISG